MKPTRAGATRRPWDLNELTGILEIKNGGTGEITAVAAITALLPSQFNNLGKLLSTNGTTVQWTASGGGTGGTPQTVIFVQNTPLSLWTINHGLGAFPSVTVVDSGGNSVVGSVHYVSDDQITIGFSAAFSGTAYLN